MFLCDVLNAFGSGYFRTIIILSPYTCRTKFRSHKNQHEKGARRSTTLEICVLRWPGRNPLIRTVLGARTAFIMSRFSGLTMLFSITILFGLFDAIASNQDMFEGMSVEQKQRFFGTEDGSIPEFEVVELPHPVRSKRASPRDPLVITFTYYGSPTTTRLDIIRDSDLVSPSTTGIWLADSKPNANQGVLYNPRPDIFDLVGPFDMFQNSEDSSAVTRFWTPGSDLSIMGILKQTYAVRSVKLCSDTGGQLPCYHHDPNIKRSVDSAEDKDPNSSVYLVIYKLPEVPLEYFKRRIIGNETLDNLTASRKKRQQPRGGGYGKTVYPKLLLSADYSLIGGMDATEFTRELITHVNAVDTMYRSLTNPEVRLRVAGIIIPWDAGAVPYISRHYEPGGKINAQAVLDSTHEFFSFEQFRFPRGIFDAVLMMTKYDLYAPNNFGQFGGVKGLADLRAACNNVAAAIAQYTPDLKGVLVMAHELGHVLGSDHDGEGTSWQCSPAGGFTMAPGDPWARLLKWSKCSRAAFRTFFKSSLGDCMYNRPDEVPNWVKKMPGAWTSINGQCANDFKGVTGYRWRPDPSYCDAYECQIGNRYQLVNHPPLDGTRHEYGQRCIGGMWQ